jgi:hypothetical protein
MLAGMTPITLSPPFAYAYARLEASPSYATLPRGLRYLLNHPEWPFGVICTRFPIPDRDLAAYHLQPLPVQTVPAGRTVIEVQQWCPQYYEELNGKRFTDALHLIVNQSVAERERTGQVNGMWRGVWPVIVREPSETPSIGTAWLEITPVGLLQQGQAHWDSGD